MMNNKVLFGKTVWFITGASCLCVGLGALGFDMETMLHLSSVSDLIRYGVGLSGALSLIMLSMSCSSGSHCPSC